MKLKFGKKPKRVPRCNPLIAAYGPGPEGKHCRDCVHLYGRQYARTYYKCDKWVNTNSITSDHAPSWPACGAFEDMEIVI